MKISDYIEKEEEVKQVEENLEWLQIFFSEYQILIDESGDSVIDFNMDVEEHHIEDQGEAWFYWFSFPGCLPDSEPFGPFQTEEEALLNAIEIFG